ncbi:hypothetical protein J3700_004409 [Salmonella enterica subsp. enterica serovar Enteritidis]|nr:hypothetical protein [Salmonella enterica]EHG7813914.1 hypothetical protein [Salmonella enterica subsp. enterica serovar Enteritidis]EHJ0722371.1 hypothetical protein [Salmonella enterica subsp. enterica serovar Enteritidis]EJO6345776.1 hypothetical protein [Salmonella enterica]
MQSKNSKKNEREVIKKTGDHFMVVGKTGQGKTAVLLEVMEKVIHLKNCKRGD